ncbi:MAG: hypothetical protein H0U73_06155 [Tatlockia sp.]|nr:hypothetical protein [Tatlockia sp.]
MPRGFFKMLKPEKPKTVLEGNKLLEEVLKKFHESDLEFFNLKHLIIKRKDAFLLQIDSIADEKSKQPFIAAYVNFAKNLNDYFAYPGDIKERISNYHNSNHYYHVGGDDNEWSYSFADKLADYILKFSLLVLLTAIVSSPLSLTFGLMVLSLAITLMGPSFLYTVAVTKQNASKVKIEETEIFMKAQIMVDPENVVDLSDERNSAFSLLPCF